jgi:hypothetical protein
VNRLVNPICVDKEGVAAGPSPPSPTEDCPEGFDREFDPITDINVGIISSSLGALTAAQCDGNPQASGDQNDKARLLSRAAPVVWCPTFERQGLPRLGP